MMTMPPAQTDLQRLTGEDKRTYVRDMFTSIAPRYDLLNHLLSFNIDRSWRKTAINFLDWERAPRGDYLDLCAGTMDLAAELSGRSGFLGRAVGADFVLPMLQRGRSKGPIQAVGADALELPFGPGSFDGCTVGFGIRNLADLEAGLKEISRVLKPDARIVILEFCTPTSWPLRPIYMFYFRRLLPLIGRTVAKHSQAYSYLPASVLEFATPVELAVQIRAAGFSGVEYQKLTGGIAAIHWGTKLDS